MLRSTLSRIGRGKSKPPAESQKKRLREKKTNKDAMRDSKNIPSSNPT